MEAQPAEVGAAGAAAAAQPMPARDLEADADRVLETTMGQQAQGSVLAADSQWPASGRAHEEQQARRPSADVRLRSHEPMSAPPLLGLLGGEGCEGYHQYTTDHQPANHTTEPMAMRSPGRGPRWSMGRGVCRRHRSNGQR